MVDKKQRKPGNGGAADGCDGCIHAHDCSNAADCGYCPHTEEPCPVAVERFLKREILGHITAAMDQLNVTPQMAASVLFTALMEIVPMAALQNIAGVAVVTRRKPGDEEVPDGPIH